MKSLSLIAAAALACLIAPAAHAGDAAVEAPIRTMTDAFNRGDIAAVKAVHVPAPTIVDNVAPFIWTGPNAFDQWLTDLGKAEAEQGKSDGHVTFAPVVDEVVKGDRAYVVTRCIYSYKQNGHQMTEDGFTAFTLVKVGAEWKVESWSWASPTAKMAH